MPTASVPLHPHAQVAHARAHAHAHAHAHVHLHVCIHPCLRASARAPAHASHVHAQARPPPDAAPRRSLEARCVVVQPAALAGSAGGNAPPRGAPPRACAPRAAHAVSAGGQQWAKARRGGLRRAVLLPGSASSGVLAACAAGPAFLPLGSGRASLHSHAERRRAWPALRAAGTHTPMGEDLMLDGGRLRCG